jgi:hypothetical protein
MSPEIEPTLNELVRSNVISPQQIADVTEMFIELKKNWLANPSRTLLEPLKSSVPESWQRIGNLSYEDGWLLFMAVAASNTKRAFESSREFSSKFFQTSFFQPKAE